MLKTLHTDFNKVKYKTKSLVFSMLRKFAHFENINKYLLNINVLFLVCYSNESNKRKFEKQDRKQFNNV